MPRLGPRRAFVLALALVAMLGVGAAAPRRASPDVSVRVVTPWSEEPIDTLAAFVKEARSRFQANAGDSVGGPNYRAYEMVGRLSRRALRSLGPRGLLQGYALKPMLDSLGFDADVVLDPSLPMFALVMVRNPFRLGADAVGFLYWWYRDQDLRMQGVVFRGGQQPAMRVWWTGQPERPYEWAVVEHERGNGATHVTLLQLSPSGSFWAAAQSDADTPLFGDPGEAVFADLDRDGTPELVQWAIPRTDSLFVPCSDCPRLVTERTFVEREGRFELEDSRVLPSPYATLVTFVRLLIDDRRAEAGRLVRDPAMVTRAIAAGWGARRRSGAWQVEYAEPGQRWPRWLEVRFDGPQGVKRYVVHFSQRDGRWIIERWVEPQPPQRKPEARGE